MGNGPTSSSSESPQLFRDVGDTLWRRRGRSMDVTTELCREGRLVLTTGHGSVFPECALRLTQEVASGGEVLEIIVHARSPLHARIMRALEQTHMIPGIGDPCIIVSSSGSDGHQSTISTALTGGINPDARISCMPRSENRLAAFAEATERLRTILYRHMVPPGVERFLAKEGFELPLSPVEPWCGNGALLYTHRTFLHGILLTRDEMHIPRTECIIVDDVFPRWHIRAVRTGRDNGNRRGADQSEQITSFDVDELVTRERISYLVRQLMGEETPRYGSGMDD